MPDYELFELGDVVLQSGLTLQQAKLAYKTYGSLAPRARQRHRDADLLWWAARRHRTDDAGRTRARSNAVLRY